MRLHSAGASALPPDADASPAPVPGRFERTVLPHLSAGFTLARYLTGNNEDAEDAVQEAVLRAVRYFHTLRNDDARAWFLTIVRRVCFTSYSSDYPTKISTVSLDSSPIQLVDEGDAPDSNAQRELVKSRIRDAMDQLPPLLRETLILREIQACSYAEIATVTESPIGTVMSRLSRARQRLAESLRDVIDFGDLA